MVKISANQEDMTLTACAALIGLAPEDEEMLSLLLEIVGWKPMVAAQPCDGTLKGMRLVFAGHECFASVATALLPLATTLVLVAGPDLPIIAKGQAVLRLASPINLSEAEQLINSMSANLPLRNS